MRGGDRGLVFGLEISMGGVTETKPGEKPGDGVCVDGKENAPRALGEPTL